MNTNYQKWKSLQSHWDDDDFLKSLTPLMKLRYKRLSEKVTDIFTYNFAKVPGKPLLIDAGAGRVEYALFLKKSWGNDFEPWKYLGLEPSPEQLKQRDIATLGLGFMRATAEQIPLQDMVAQGVLMKEALDHCYDPSKVFSEAKRLLPGINNAHKAKQTDHLFFFGPDDLKKLAQDAWFDRVSVETYNYLKFPRFLEIALGWLGEPLNRSLLSLTDAIGQALLPGMGGGIILTAHKKE